MSTKIYTKTGDKGKTSLIGGTKVSKSDLRIESYGTIDELNSFIGLLGDSIHEESIQLFLREIQDRLFTIGASLASDPEKAPQMKIPDLKPEDVSRLEHEIDQMEAQLEPMKSFILPGGHPTVSTAHIVRCVCRRAERACVALEKDSFVEPLVLIYLNRLSDYLFVLARYLAYRLQVSEIPWRPRK
ncbi:MAG TPA: cob(I)yrinic acid a,c-diamide adenosyltransferase [Puia sp.]|nr:cob(I)yrinic acid a,c-diamide adenosyltransferase [Puia sp.]